METNSPDCAVIGIGNLLRGDDGIGPRTVEEVRKNHTRGVQYFELNTPAYDLITYFHDFRTVLIIDAAEFGGTPGEIKRVTRDRILSREKSAGTSLHDIDLISVIDYASQLGITPENLVIYCIQLQTTEMSDRLSAPVERSLPEVVRQVSRDIQCMSSASQQK